MTSSLPLNTKDYKQNKDAKTMKVLTIYNVRGEHQMFNNLCYSWIIGAGLIEVCRNDEKWHAYYPMANVVRAEVEEVKRSRKNEVSEES